MTFIKPQKEFNLLSMIIVALVILMIGATGVLVFEYNKIVNAEHNIASMKAEIDQLGAANTGLQNQIVALLGSDAASQAAAQDGLVNDPTPQYMPVAAVTQNQSLTLR